MSIIGPQQPKADELGDLNTEQTMKEPPTHIDLVWEPQQMMFKLLCFILQLQQT